MATPEPPSTSARAEDDAEMLADLPDELVEELAEEAAEEAAEPEPAPRAPESRKASAAARPVEKPSASSQRAGRAEPKSERLSGRPSTVSSRRGLPTTSERLKRERAQAEDPSSRKSERKTGAEVEASRGSARRSQRVSIREKAAPQPLLSTKLKLSLIGLLVLGVGGAVAYRPVKRSMLLADLEAGKQSAAKELYEWDPEYALPAFVEHVHGGQGEALKAAAHGLQLAVNGGSADALKAAGELLAPKDGAAAERLAVAQALIESAGHFAQQEKSEKKGSKSQEKLHANSLALVKIFIRSVDEDTEQDVRLAALDGLGKLPVAGGGCERLLKVVKEEKGEPRAHALRGIEPSAVPGAVGALLTQMGDAEDKELAAAARAGFAKVRNYAEVGALTKELGNPMEEVRLEIVKALGSRRGNSAAAKGVAQALGDKAAPVRIEALHALPLMPPSVDDLHRLEPLVADQDPGVRIATAEALSALRDEITWKILLQSFEKGLEGPSLNAFVKALSVRGGDRLKGSRKKDMESIQIVMASLERQPQSRASICEALVQLTLSEGSPHREAERKRWPPQKWKDWYANIKKRDELETAANKLLESASNQRSNIDKYPELLKVTDEGIEKLETCIKMCEPNDPEDVPRITRRIEDATRMRMLFFKSQHL